jgi:hypothetical protein
VLTVAIVNPNESAQSLDLTWKGIALSGKGKMWRMTGPSVSAITGLKQHEVQVVETVMKEVPKALTVAPISIEIYEFEKQ